MRAIIFLLFFYSHSVFASNGYKCTIESAKVLENGAITENAYAKSMLNKEFTVDKGTGRTIGAILNYNEKAEPKILDDGSTKGQAYKVITIFGPYTTIYYLYVSEYDKEAKKSFMFIKGSDIYSGVCVNY